MKRRWITFIRIIKETGAHKVLLIYLLFVFIAAWIVLLTEPGITRYGDALWYCYDVISTTGFGDVVVCGFVARTLSVAVTVYTLIVTAILTGVFSNFYMQVIRERQHGTIAAFLDSLEHLPELSKEELT
ncbi:MAG: potassium channel family protein, partial [Lachnospiraceae bacterium]|nr:potassium channel family protein [Lachnospiraceae bacterium]